ncbi:hypothetical protein ACHAXT_007603 [Thalassiosira profunda]
MHLAALLAAVAGLAAAAHPAVAFVAGTRRALGVARPSSLAATALAAEYTTVADAKLQLERAISGTDRGRSLSPSQRTKVHSLLSDLEPLCPLAAPARDPRMEGPWVVLYTDAPPPSNGQLGPLKGIAKQVIDLDGGRYRNELYVGGSGDDEDEGAWLTAVLDATWKEWDGVYLDADGGAAAPADTAIDHGATTWKVDFESLQLSLFGIPLFTQQFQAGTSRTWKMTYLDDTTRIVRAGKTGRGEDDWVFYMRRGHR